MNTSHSHFKLPARWLAAVASISITLLSVPSMARAQEAQDSSGYGPQLRMGQWDHMLMGTFTPLPEDQIVTNKYLGLRHAETWFDLFLRNDSNRYFLASNAVQNLTDGGELTARTWVPTLESTPEGGVVPDPRYQPWTGKPVQEITPDKKNKYTVATKASTEEVIFNERTLEWTSKNGDVRLKGELATPAAQFILPWREPNGDTDLMYYTAQFYKVDGKFYGETVSGYTMIEHMWGTRNYADTWWVKNRVGIWMNWTTTFDDGTTEMGEILCGKYGARAALIVNSQGKKVLNTTEFNDQISADGKRVVFTFTNGPQWEFNSEISLGRIGFVGVTKRIGETRKIVRAHAMYTPHREKTCEPLPLNDERTHT
jgi:hypothetical protein